MNPNERLDLGNFLPYLVNRVGAALVERFSRDALAAHDLSIAMWRVLAALSNAGEQRQIDLAAMTSTDVSTLSRLVSRLVRRGLVTRRRSRLSSREVVVALSRKGTAVVRELIPLALALQDQALAGIPARDVTLMKQALRTAYENLAVPEHAATGSGPVKRAARVRASQPADVAPGPSGA